MAHPCEPPLFSVIIPCYNRAHFLPETIASVIVQHISNLELIIVNDGSTDNTTDVVCRLINDNLTCNIRLLEQNNQGQAAARNSGIALSSGQWIVALDSDDILAEGFLIAVEKAAINEPQANVFTGAYKEFGARKSEWKLTNFNPERLKTRCNILCCSPFRRTLWEAVGGYDASHPFGWEDMHFWLKCLSVGLKLVSLPLPMLYYRIHEGNIHSFYEKFQEDGLAMHHCMLPGIYSKQDISTAHNRLMCMDQATYNALHKKITTHPNLPLPYFWLGLAHEGRGEYKEALQFYATAMHFSWTGSWQVRERIEGIHSEATYKNSGLGPKL